MTHASTFSGIGGPEVAAAMLGWDNLFHCEINSFPRSVLQYWFPDSISYEDITKTDFSQWRGQVDVLTGGFPCQPFSYAGKRRGSQDDRYLWPFMLRCIEQVRPTWFVGENVAGINTMVLPGEDVKMGQQTDLFGEGDEFYEKHERYVLHEIIQNLERAGYSVQPFVIPACAVGAPHRRDRVFIVAHRIAPDPSCGGSGAQAENDRLIGEWSDRLSQQSERRDTTERTDGLSAVSGHSPNTESDGRRCLQPDSLATQPMGTPQRMPGDSHRPCGQQPAAHTHGQQGHRRKPEQPETKKSQPSQFRRGDFTNNHLLPENRWRTFPSVPPVHRGNDGIPFPLDRLTIPAAKWRKEALKAYGNAIVPQVMYEIFRAIQQIENIKQHTL